MYPFAKIIDHIHGYLQQQTAAVGEYEIIQAIDSEGFFAHAKTFSPSLQLFHKHFVTMHCLYRLQQALYPQGLDIGPLAIRLHPSGIDIAASSAIADDLGELRSYYLDLNHLDEATEHSVAHLLKQFWQRFDGHTRSDDAFAALGLSHTASWNEVKQAYRQQVQQAHPDKGGSREDFARAHEAYQTLKRRFG